MDSAVTPSMTAADLLAKARARYERVTPAQALAEQLRGALLVDTRSADAIRADGLVPGAHRVSLSTLPWRVDPAGPWSDAALADRDARLIVLCQDGYSSSLAVEWLLDLGFARATDMEGGVTAWIEAGLPIERSEDPG
ncbi:MAG TPA: rhodanese-like domain-containing protein [Candidatus Limnocylindrales bacterium]|nr:rhodanese-like domain-containing protein [Candidatus Limnocylindrales bacterium]